MKIYIPLLNEGVPVLRPTRGEVMSQGIYRILPTPDYDAEVEEWAFPPGSLVRCEYENHDGERMFVAQEKIHES